MNCINWGEDILALPSREHGLNVDDVLDGLQKIQIKTVPEEFRNHFSSQRRFQPGYTLRTGQVNSDSNRVPTVARALDEIVEHNGDSTVHYLAIAVHILSIGEAPGLNEDRQYVWISGWEDRSGDWYADLVTLLHHEITGWRLVVQEAVDINHVMLPQGAQVTMCLEVDYS